MVEDCRCGAPPNRRTPRHIGNMRHQIPIEHPAARTASDKGSLVAFLDRCIRECGADGSRRKRRFPILDAGGVKGQDAVKRLRKDKSRAVMHMPVCDDSLAVAFEEECANPGLAAASHIQLPPFDEFVLSVGIHVKVKFAIGILQHPLLLRR